MGKFVTSRGRTGRLTTRIVSSCCLDFSERTMQHPHLPLLSLVFLLRQGLPCALKRAQCSFPHRGSFLGSRISGAARGTQTASTHETRLQGQRGGPQPRVKALLQCLPPFFPFIFLHCSQKYSLLSICPLPPTATTAVMLLSFMETHLFIHSTSFY